MAKSILSLLALTSSVVAQAAAESTPKKKMPYLRDADLQKLTVHYDPEEAKDKWMSVSEDVEFLPLLDARKVGGRKLEDNVMDDYFANIEAHGAYSEYNPFSVQPFIEGMGRYDEYQQAWRLLGFMIDCNDVIYEDDEEEGGGHSRDNQVLSGQGCGRFIMWAAYVDLAYEGGGIGEYQYWNKDKQAWDDNACYYGREGGKSSNNSGYKTRCAKMDCHLPDTSFQLLGFFKHRRHDAWMEQLFKHEGMCVWSDEQYAFMKHARKQWPKGCTSTGQTKTISGRQHTLYYNIKPLRSGRIAFGLYTDEQCIDEYSANTKTLESIIGNAFENADSHDSGDGGFDFSGDSLSDGMNRWDAAFDVWHYCHPCVAHDLENTDGRKYVDVSCEEHNDEEDDYYYYEGGNYQDGNYQDENYQDENYQDENYQDENYQDENQNQRKLRFNQRKLGFESCPTGEIFECYDDAGYTNVNQCMKFSAKTVMKTATFRDLSLAKHQGTLVKNPLAGYYDDRHVYFHRGLQNAANYFFVVASSAALAFSVWNFYKFHTQATRRNVGDGSNSESLL